MPETTPVMMQMPVLPGHTYTGRVVAGVPYQPFEGVHGGQWITLHAEVKQAWQPNERVRGTGWWLFHFQDAWRLSVHRPLLGAGCCSVGSSWKQGDEVFAALIGDNLPLHLLDLPPAQRKVRL